MDFVVEFLKYLEERHPVWGRRVATALLIVVGIAVFGVAARYIWEDIVAPIGEGAVLFSGVLAAHQLSLPPDAGRHLLSGIIGGLPPGILFFVAYRFLIRRPLNRLAMARSQFWKEYGEKRREIAAIVAELSTAADKVRGQEIKDFEDFKAQWERLDAQHKENMQIVRGVASQVIGAHDAVQRAARAVGERTGDKDLTLAEESGLLLLQGTEQKTQQ